MKPLVGAAFLGVSLLATGCGGQLPLRSSADRPDAAQVDDLKTRVIELQRKAAMSDVEIARLSQRVAELEDSLAGRGGRRASAPSSTAVEAPEPVAEMALPPAREIRPSTPSSKPAVRPVPSASQAPPVATPARPSPSTAPGRLGREVKPPVEETDLELPPAAKPAPAPPAKPQQAAPAPSSPAIRPSAPPASTAKPAPSPATAEGTEGGEPPMAAQALYDRGYTLYHQKRFDDAEASFARYVKAEPTSDLADNAQYWIGECRYAKNDMRGALAAFRETVERFPQGNKVPDALLKAAQSLEGMGDKEEARATYGEVVRRFPTSAAAAVAEERRAKLR
jgi:tol-pal system protein YbgF